MSGQPIDPQPEATEPTTAPAETAADAEVPETLEAARKLRSENRSLRQRLHTAEADIERLVTQAGARQRADIERTAAEVLVDPADVWRVDPELQQSFYDTEFGEISGDSVIAAAKQLASEKPHLARPNTAPPPSAQPIEGLRPGASPAAKPKPTSWAAAIRGTGI